jgi:hypothetical protein
MSTEQEETDGLEQETTVVVEPPEEEAPEGGDPVDPEIDTGDPEEPEEPVVEQPETEVVETPETPEPETAEPLSPEFAEKAKKIFVGKQFKSDKEMVDAVFNRITDLEIYYSENEEATQKITQVLDDQPEIGEIIRDMGKGATFAEALMRHVDLEDLKPVKGDPDFEAWEEAKKERKRRIYEAKKFQDGLVVNRETSIKNIEKFRVEKKLTEEEMNQFAATLQKTLVDVIDGKFQFDFLNLMYDALKFKPALAEALKQGEIKGRNTKIEELKGKAQPKGDGLPSIKSQGVPEKPKVDAVAKGIVDFAKQRNRFDQF